MLAVGLVLAAAFARAAAPMPESGLYVVHYEHWSEEDERDYGEFIAAIGESARHSVDACLHRSRACPPASRSRATNISGLSTCRGDAQKQAWQSALSPNSGHAPAAAKDEPGDAQAAIARCMGFVNSNVQAL